MIKLMSSKLLVSGPLDTFLVAATLQARGVGDGTVDAGTEGTRLPVEELDGDEDELANGTGVWPKPGEL
jgi:hypothetical protein